MIEQRPCGYRGKRVVLVSCMLPLLPALGACGSGGGSSMDRARPAGVADTPVAPQPETGGKPDDSERGSPSVSAPPSAGEAPFDEPTPLDESMPLDESAPLDEPTPPDESAPPDAKPRLGEEASGDWPIPALEWTPCQNGFECAFASVPRDYADPQGPQYRVAVTRRPARDPERRIGPLFFNFGGPGAGAVGALRGTANGRFAALNERFDLVAFDPRGTGASEGAIDCRVDQETEGLYAQPFITPLDLDVDFWTTRAQRYVDACVGANEAVIRIAATANVARDMDLLRAALGEESLSYFGFSYGTFLGATYASLFPHRYRSVVLDGPVDPDEYINRPSEELRTQSEGFELSLSRFFEACASEPAACRGFGGDDPALAYDRLVADATRSPVPVPGNARPLDGDDILFATGALLYSKASWNTLAAALAALEAGDPVPMRQLTDQAYGRNGDGSFDPSFDAYFVLGAAEQAFPTDPQAFLDGGAAASTRFTHFFSNTGYSELPYGLFPVHSSGVFRGPFVASPDAPPILVVGTTFDPATPYSGAVAMVEQLGNARLLTMQGDGHGAYGGNSTCINGAVDAYLAEGVLPETGAECEQQIRFGAANAILTSASTTAVGSPAASDLPAVSPALFHRGRPLPF